MANQKYNKKNIDEKKKKNFSIRQLDAFHAQHVVVGGSSKTSNMDVCDALRNKKWSDRLIRSESRKTSIE